MKARAELDGDQLIAARDVDADVGVVWEAFTTPEHLAAFWGGHHATVPAETVSVDLRVGGAFELETIGPDGRGSRLRFRYEVVEPPTRLVLSEARFGITTEICLKPAPRGTTVVIRQRRLPSELQTEQARSGLAGILEQLDRALQMMASDERSDES